jgi:hypothetical protein
MFDDDSGATYYTMPGTAAVAWTRPASLDLKDPTTMAEVELRALINQAGWDDDSVDGIELLALGQAARAAIAEQEVAATYDDANASGDAGDAPHDDEDEGANVKNDWNEDGAADEEKNTAADNSECAEGNELPESGTDENANGDHVDDSAAWVEDAPYWIGELKPRPCFRGFHSALPNCFWLLASVFCCQKNTTTPPARRFTPTHPRARSFGKSRRTSPN